MEKVLALLLTDLVDSTATNTRLGDAAMGRLWDEHDTGSRELARRFGGREIDRSDGFLMVFDDPVQAAGFAAAYHRMLDELTTPLKARAGLHLGRLTLRQNTPEDVALGAKPVEAVGIAKAFAARLMALALPGQTLVSSQALSVLSSAGMHCMRHGHWRFKGVDEPVEVGEVGDADSPFAPPPDVDKAFRVVSDTYGQWVCASAIPHRLPGERDAFFGRSADLRSIARSFDEGARLVVLQGAGGIGKTRLASRYGWAWLGQYPGGAYFCDLSTARSLDGVLHAVARGLDVPLDHEPLFQIGHVIEGRGRCLLILDNFEQVASLAPSTLGQWLDKAAGARFLVTSREKLGITGQRTVLLEPLGAEDSIALFHARAQAADDRYQAAATPVASMNALVALLDGLPLALELAAARVGVLPPAQLLARMEDRFRLLAVRSGRPERQATMRAAIEWSWETLSPTERSALGQLSVFEGGFSLDAAEAVLDCAGLEPSSTPWIVDIVQALVDKSLLRGERGERFGFLAAIHQFAAGRLAADPAAADLARQRHWRHFAGIGEQGATAEQCRELENLIAACRAAAESGAAGEATDCLRLAWACLRLVGPFAVAVDLARAVLAVHGLQKSQAAMAHWVAGAALHAAGAMEDARSHACEGLRLIAVGLDHEIEARLHCLAGEVESIAGHSAKAADHLDRARDLAELTGNTGLQCQILNATGALAADQGRMDAARIHYEMGLAVAKAAGDLRWQGGLLGNLGYLLYGEGRLDDASLAFLQTLSLARQSGDRRWEGNVHCNLGLMLLEQGKPTQALQHLERALAIARHLGHRTLDLTVTCNLGLAREATGELEAACRLHQEAVQGAARLGDYRSEGRFRACLASALARCGRTDDARACALDGLGRVARADDPVVHGLLLCALGEVEHRRGESARAAFVLGEASDLLGAMGWGPNSELGRAVARCEGFIRG